MDWAIAYGQLAVARWLLANGADVHHISAKGWTPAFSLFGGEVNVQKQSEDFLTLLSGAAFDNFDAQDREGYTIMHRAALVGTGNHIRHLKSRNVSLDIHTKKLSWTPIFCSVVYDNLSTFTELVQYDPNFLEARDIRQWTLLHVAVNSSSLDIMRLLVQLGADPHALSYPSECFVPEDLKGLALTPGDIASVRGLRVFTAYLDTLTTSGYEVCGRYDEVDDTHDIFWSALEEFPKENSAWRSPDE